MHGSMSVAETNEPSSAKKAMLRGVGVSRIQKGPCVGASKTKTIPSAPPRSVTPIRPRERSSGVAATHRHRAQTSPSAAVTSAAWAANPAGTTPVVGVLAVEAAMVVGAAVGSLTVGALASSPPHAASTSTSENHRHDIVDTVGVSVTPCPPPMTRRVTAVARRASISTPCTVDT